jgi:hypothetical protein
VSSHDALVVVQKGDQSLGPHMSAMMKIEQQPRTYLAVRGLRDGRGYRRPDGAVTDAEALGDRPMAAAQGEPLAKNLPRVSHRQSLGRPFLPLGVDGAWAVPRRYAPATLPLEDA